MTLCIEIRGTSSRPPSRLTLWCCLALVSALTSACGEEEPSAPAPAPASPTEPSAERVDEEPRSEELEIAPLVQERSTFKTEVTTFGVYDSALQTVGLPAGYEDDLPGPRLLVIGRILNASEEPIHRGGVFGHLEVCADDDKCVDRPSHGRGFTVPLSGTAPWRPGTWRHFTVLTRPADPVYRELDLSEVRGRLELKAHGPIEVEWEGKIWNSPVPWRAFGGYPVMETASLAQPLKQRGLKLDSGAPVRVLAVAGMKACLLNGKRETWIPLDEQALPRGVLSHIAPPTPLPAKSVGDGLTVRILQHRIAIRPPLSKDDTEKRFLVVEVEVTSGPDKKRKIAANAFRLVAGHHATVNPSKETAVTDQPLAFGKVDKGVRRRGDVVFELPFGVNPLVLTVQADKASYVEIAL